MATTTLEVPWTECEGSLAAENSSSSDPQACTAADGKVVHYEVRGQREKGGQENSAGVLGRRSPVAAGAETEEELVKMAARHWATGKELELHPQLVKIA